MRARGGHMNIPHIHLERGTHAIRYTCDCGWAGTPRPYGDTTRTIHIEAIRHSSHHKVGGPPPGPTPHDVGPGSPGGGPTNQPQEEQHADQ